MDAVTIGIVAGLLGAFTGVSSLGWHVFTHITDRGRLKIQAIRGVHYNTDNEITKREVMCIVTNVGRQPIVVTQIDVLYKGGVSYAAGFMSKQLPSTLPPGEFIIIKPDDLSDRFGPPQDVTSMDSIGRTYRLSKKNRKEINQ